jgi:hypothetical protein
LLKNPVGVSAVRLAELSGWTAMPNTTASLRAKAAQCRWLAQQGTRKRLPPRRWNYLLELADRLDREARGIERTEAGKAHA